LQTRPANLYEWRNQTHSIAGIKFFISQKNSLKRTMNRFAVQFFDACNKHNKREILSFYHEKYQGESIAQSMGINGIQLISLVVDRAFASFPDLQFVLLDTISEGNKVAAVWLLEGTQMGKVMNIPPTKRKVKVKGTTIFEIEDEKITKSDTLFDLAAMLRQMGLLPEVQLTQAK
jgi:steroid delta-isomerase-like uncharacterized protein